MESLVLLGIVAATFLAPLSGYFLLPGDQASLTLKAGSLAALGVFVSYFVGLVVTRPFGGMGHEASEIDDTISEQQLATVKRLLRWVVAVVVSAVIMLGGVLLGVPRVPLVFAALAGGGSAAPWTHWWACGAAGFPGFLLYLPLCGATIASSLAMATLVAAANSGGR